MKMNPPTEQLSKHTQSVSTREQIPVFEQVTLVVGKNGLATKKER
jgi:hypothetical protein